MTADALISRGTDLRRVLHLVVDAALVADDAIDRGDADALRRGVEIMTAHVATIRAHIMEIADA